MTDYAKVLVALRPDASWSLDENDFGSLVWHGPGDPPTLAECDAAWPQVQYERARAKIEEARRRAYQFDSDPLYFRWQRGDTTEQEWLDAVLAVKAAHPWPDTP
jgi:hypothetical protein